ncbi:hypothetical protein [Flavobacterium chungbukense]|uniref:Lipoprotein n=1 Tax=Flavobacterium chungbukense TaxID=877464 RepID=A0ABP7Y850_9FLAO|nr:hypothetical protein [Flavobacterium chungbukense]MCC4923824.1 hypothetical protein [Flavobacterium chungbukense]
MKRFSIYLTAFLFIIISSCKSSKTADFKESINQWERRAFEITIGKEGPGEKKLNCLVKEDYKGALSAVDQQRKEFDVLIDDIKKLSTGGIPKGESLKNASLEYYKSLKELHLFDRKEIEQQEILQTLKNKKLNVGLNNLMTLARQKKMLYTAVYKKEALLQTATENFDAVNGY